MKAGAAWCLTTSKLVMKTSLKVIDKPLRGSWNDSDATLTKASICYMETCLTIKEASLEMQECLGGIKIKTGSRDRTFTLGSQYL